MLTGKEEAYFARAESKRLKAVNDELLAALRAVLANGGTTEDEWLPMPIYRQAIAAIKKAEGIE